MKKAMSKIARRAIPPKMSVREFVWGLKSSSVVEDLLARCFPQHEIFDGAADYRPGDNQNDREQEW
jgi:hypothetical protein